MNYNYNNNGIFKLSVNRRPGMGNTPIVINDYKKNQHFV